MTLSKFKYLQTVLLLVLSHTFHLAHADAVRPCSSESPSKLSNLIRINCDTTDSITIERYSDQRKNSPYETEFDSRNLAVATGNNLTGVYTVAGIKSGRHSTQVQTRLLAPPFADQIAVRQISPKVKKFKNWRITIEHIQYPSKQAAPGYALNCATAIKKSPPVRVVAECYPLENWNHFLEILDLLQ